MMLKGGDNLLKDLAIAQFGFFHLGIRNSGLAFIRSLKSVLILLNLIFTQCSTNLIQGSCISHLLFFQIPIHRDTYKVGADKLLILVNSGTTKRAIKDTDHGQTETRTNLNERNVTLVFACESRSVLFVLLHNLE